jgi:ribosomal protein S18 acetylase RimI-like enzyme
MSIERVTAITPEICAAFERLMPQLSPSKTPPTARELNEIIASPDVLLYIARDEQGIIIGSLTLAFYRTLTALHAWIEDVVVDETVRCQGLGTALTEIAIEEAKARGARCVNLTCRPVRVAANRLYQKMGFKHWVTNAYHYEFGAKA